MALNILPTTVVGSYTVPDWYPVLAEAVANGSLAPETFEEARAVAARAAIKDQEMAGIQIVSDGELFRRQDNRFGPPNAMIASFAHKIPGFSSELRPKTGISPVAPTASLPAPVVESALLPASLGLLDELRFLRATTHLPVKIAMTGPHMFARVAWDEYYHDPEALALSMAAVINTELRRLDEAGCDVIQIDEPILWFLPQDQPWGIRAVNACFAGVKRARKVLHVCQGILRNTCYFWDLNSRIVEYSFPSFSPPVIDSMQMLCANTFFLYVSHAQTLRSKTYLPSLV